MSGEPTVLLDRRGFLRTTAGGTAAIAIASLLPTGCTADYPAARADGVELKAFTEKEYGITRAAAEALLVGVPVEPRVIALRIDHELAMAGDPMRTDFKTTVMLLEHLTLMGGHVRRFTQLTPAQRLAYLNGWGRSRIALRRAAYFAVKGFVYYFTYSDPVTRNLTGFPGPWPERVAIAAYPVDFGDVS